MDPKYSNIFWHEGVKIYEENMLSSPTVQTRINHLENDVTKSLINLFQHCDERVLGSFLRSISVIQDPKTFQFEFQVTDNKTYQNKKNRIMLTIVSKFTDQISIPGYQRGKGRPDACIFNQDTVILIEAKTQSPLVHEQIEYYIQEYLGTVTIRRLLTWEFICELLQNQSFGKDTIEGFLLAQFVEFLSYLGLAEFRGFLVSDFELLGSIGKLPNDEFLDSKRSIHSKVNKFMNRLYKPLQEIIQYKDFDKEISKVKLEPGLWSTLYFKDNEKTPINYYPNINLYFENFGIQLSLNAETRSSVDFIIDFIEKFPVEFEKRMKELEGYKFSFFYRYEFRPREFIWKEVPGFPKNSLAFNSEEFLNLKKVADENWNEFCEDLLSKMNSGYERHAADRLYTEKELNYAYNHNKRSNYAIRVEKIYPPEMIEPLGKDVETLFVGAVKKLESIILSILDIQFSD